MGGVDRIIPTFHEQRDMAAGPSSIFTFNFCLLTFALSQLQTATNKLSSTAILRPVLYSYFLCQPLNFFFLPTGVL